MDKANGDAPFIPLYGTAVPGARAGTAGWGCPPRACACTGTGGAGTRRLRRGDPSGRPSPLRAGAYRARRRRALH